MDYIYTENRMDEDGGVRKNSFYLSANRVWLTKDVPTRFLSKYGRQFE